MGGMAGPKGEPIGAVFGFVRDVLYLMEKKQPDYLFCAFDMPGPTFRHEMYDDYKANRPPMPDDLRSQIAAIRRMLDALGVPALGVESYEADDVLAALAWEVDRLGGQCHLVTTDKDCRQLLTDRVSLYNIRKDAFYDAQSLLGDWGIAPRQVVDFQALVGDSSDNVPGVALIGPKLAKELLVKYGDLENVLDHAHEVSGKKRKQNLMEGRDVAMLSRRLVRLDRNMPVQIDWNAARPGRIDLPATERLFDEFGFRSLTDKIRNLAGRPAAANVPTHAEPTYHLVDTTEALAALAAELAQQKLISVDTETTSLWPRWAEIVGYSFAFSEDEAYYIPVRGPHGDRFLDPAATLETLRPILENPEIGKVGQNLKYDMIVLRSAGVALQGLAFDTIVASYLLDAGERNHGLDDLAKRYLNHDTIRISELIGKGKSQKRMDEVPVAEVSNYAAEDALLPLRLRPLLIERLAEAGLDTLYTELELPLVEVLAELEYQGVQVDVERLDDIRVRLAEKIDTLVGEIYELAGHEFNIASPKQLQKVLFDELGLTPGKKTKSGPSTDAGVLEQLADVHPLPKKILAYRSVAKLKSTYVDALPEMIFPRTGRVHTSFNQVVTATGRLSSSDPNLQNIPVRTEEGREIRSAFVPSEPDWLLLAADYSQVELRVLAHFCQDERLIEAFDRDEDIHARVAGQIHDVGLDEVTSEMRREAKAVNFGVIYGQSAFGLAKQLGIDKTAAAEFIESYFQQYPGIEEFLHAALAECGKNGYVSTLLGRRRAIRGVRDGVLGQLNLAERTAINTIIQGSAADLIKRAMIAVHDRLRRERSTARMLLQIHDELIFETPAADADELAVLVIEEMSGVASLRVPLKVDVKVGPNWADAKPWGS